MVQRLDCRIIKSICRHCAVFSFYREVVELAATRLIALHKNKGKSVATCLKSRTDYAQNPDKTQQGELVSSYECSPLTVDEEFMLSKRQYELMTGRRQKNDVIAYQIRQSFKPGEITAEEANKVGYELAMRFTKGKYAFIVATHTDREHIHNHIIYNSTALDSTRKFRDFLLSGLAVQRLSDLICLEHQLSVIEIKPYRERQKRTLYPPRESNRDKLCAVIDNILLNEKPADFEAFLQKLEQQGYEIKRGKHTSVKGSRQKRFIRFRTLGAGYSEDEIKAVIVGEAEHRPHQKQPPKEQPFHLLVDIQAKLSEGKSEGYARWAKRYNLKEMSKTLIFLQENKIGSIEEMQERVDAATARYHELGDSIKAAEQRMAEIAVLRAHIVNYAKTRPVYDAYRKAGYSKKFLEEHREQITLHRAAKAAFDEAGLKKLPKVKELNGQLFDLAELKVLIDAVLSSKFITEKKSQELIKRLLALTSEQNADQLRRHIDVSDRVKSENEKGYYILDAINSAIDSKKKISFQYVDYDVNKQAFLKHDGKAYIVSPYELVWDGDFYYVIGYNDARQKVQNFRLDRIFKCPEILEDTSVPIPSDVDLILYRKSVFQMFGAEGITEVELLCHQIVMKALIDVFGQSIDTRAIDAEYFIVSIKACVSPTFLRWVFGWNGLVKIISPKEVSERYCLMLKTTLESQQSVIIGEQNDLL